MTPSVLFIAFGPRTLASSRIRAWQVAEAWPDARCVQWDGTMPDLDGASVVVLQKLHPRPDQGFCLDLLAHVRRLKAHGAMVIWDVCDPLWWWMPTARFRPLLEAMDHVVVNTPAMAESLEEDCGVRPTVICDRLPWRPCPVHLLDPPVPRLLWFGYAQNRMPCLMGAQLALRRLQIEGVPFRLTLCDDRPSQRIHDDDAISLVMDYEPWDMERMPSVLEAHDIALLPSYPGPWGPMKGDHKTADAAWSGLPVASGSSYRYLHRLLTDYQFRAEESRRWRQWAEQEREIHRTVEEWELALASLRHPVAVA